MCGLSSLFLVWCFGLFVWKPLQIPEPGCPRAARPAGAARGLPGGTSGERGALSGLAVAVEGAVGMWVSPGVTSLLCQALVLP